MTKNWSFFIVFETRLKTKKQFKYKLGIFLMTPLAVAYICNWQEGVRVCTFHFSEDGTVLWIQY